MHCSKLKLSYTHYRHCFFRYKEIGLAAGDIRISNQFLITRALHFTQLRLRVETFKLYSVTQCDSDACLIMWLCKMESTSNHKLVANSTISARNLVL